MLNARGKDRGVAVILETAILPSLEDPKNRTKAFAGYAIIQDVGLAVGSAIAGLPTLMASLWISLNSSASNPYFTFMAPV